MRIQYFSDIHLEFGQCEFPQTDADIVVAAGDIGVGTEGVDWLAKAPCPVIYVAGNHEYYSGDIEYTRQQLETACRAAQVEFLENVRADLDDVRFLGATFWTDYAGVNENVMREAEQSMNDYHYIQYHGSPLTADILLELHRESLEWLESELATAHKGKTVVVTHHAPTLKSWYRDQENSTDLRRFAYCNQYEELLKKYTIDLWIHGHIHTVSDYRSGGTRVVANPRGYHGHQEIEGYDPCRIIEI